MSHINRAIVQVPAFFLITGIIVIVNVLTQPEPTPTKNARQPPPRIVFEHTPEGMGGVRAELETVKINTEQLEAAVQQFSESSESLEKASLTPM